MLLSLLLLLTVTAVWTRVLAARAERDFPRLGRLVEVEGLRQHVLERGDGVPVVFVHGAYGALQDYAVTVLDDASERHRCVLWDRPGHGYSERPAGDADPGVQARILIGLVRELELDRPLLVGFSYGGAVCLAAALEAPDEVRGVVLLNGPSHPWPAPLDLEYRIGRVPLLGRLLSETVVAPMGALFGDRSVARAFAPSQVPARFAGSPIPLALRPASYRANTDDVALLKPFLRAQVERYPDLGVPVRALVSTDDTVVSPTIHVPELMKLVPDGQQVRIDGAGHQILYTHSDLVLRAIDDAVAEMR
ncbi:MAG: alpha/beta hydrolase [Planctomycetota bacterium]